MFNLWGRIQAWYALAWQAESIFVWETWIGPDHGWYARLHRGPRGAADWSTAGGETNLFIGTRAWLIKQVPLGQKAAGVSLLHVPVSARLARRHTPPHKGREDDTLFFNIGTNITQKHTSGWDCLEVFRCQDSESKTTSGMFFFWLFHLLQYASVHSPHPLNSTSQLYGQAHNEQIWFV